MTEITFFRHGQAGSRLDYDQLSETGREQSRHLGRHLATGSPSFDQIFCGTLKRQMETCSLVLGEFERAGIPHPEPTFSPLWNEFDLDAVYEHVSPALSAADAGFAREFTALQEMVRSGENGIHRRWTATDSKIIEAWIHGRFHVPVESWSQFRQRVVGDAASLLPSEGRVAVFTSATPIGIWAGYALDLDPLRIMRMAGAQFNTAFSRFYLASREVTLSSFNETPHLPGELRTTR